MEQKAQEQEPPKRGRGRPRSTLPPNVTMPGPLFADHHKTVSQVARMLNLSIPRIHQLMRDGVLKADKVGREWLIQKPSIAAARTRNKRRGPKPKIDAVTRKSIWEVLTGPVVAAAPVAEVGEESTITEQPS